MVLFPQTEAEYAALVAQGKTVEYAETDFEDVPPEGDGWEFWSWRRTHDEEKAVWRRIVPAGEGIE